MNPDALERLSADLARLEAIFADRAFSADPDKTVS